MAGQTETAGIACQGKVYRHHAFDELSLLSDSTARCNELRLQFTLCVTEAELFVKFFDLLYVAVMPNLSWLYSPSE